MDNNLKIQNTTRSLTGWIGGMERNTSMSVDLNLGKLEILPIEAILKEIAATFHDRISP
ncbi:MAG: hypothetical protein NC314_00975 [Roseburia sp.]|nr:hypothetical protein [Roseburia sp.]MCM1241386.1 hypothetical protein [Roseburia sp.]